MEDKIEYDYGFAVLDRKQLFKMPQNKLEDHYYYLRGLRDLLDSELAKVLMENSLRRGVNP